MVLAKRFVATFALMNSKEKEFEVVLSIGSNLGNREMHLQKAIGAIVKNCGRLLQTSSLYSTKSWGNAIQPDYLNQVLFISTIHDPDNLMTILLDIEKDMGRTRGVKWESRIIDLDILFYSNLILSSDKLTLPHPRILERRFILEPMNEILPGWIHPVVNKSIREIFLGCEDSNKVTKLVYDDSMDLNRFPSL